MRNKPIIVVLDDYERVARDYADWSAVDAQAEVRVYPEALHGQALIDALKSASAMPSCATARRSPLSSSRNCPT